MSRLLHFVFIITLSLSTTATFAEAKVEMINDMVPEGWILVYYALGDINSDGKDDAIMVVESKNNAFLKRNRVIGPKVLNMNPRQMMVLFQTPTSYEEVLRVDNGFPTEHSAKNPCLADPLVEAGGITIKNAQIKVALNYKLKCRGYDTTEHAFTFHYKDSQFRLTTFTAREFNRLSGDATEYSLDYVTGNQKIITGLNIYEKSKKHTKFQSLPSSEALYLDKISLACAPNNQEACYTKINQMQVNQAQLNDL